MSENGVNVREDGVKLREGELIWSKVSEESEDGERVELMW